MSFQAPKTVCAAMGQRLHRTKKGLHDLYKGNLPNNDANHTAEEMFMRENYDQQQPPLLSQQDAAAIWSEREHMLDMQAIPLTHVKMALFSLQIDEMQNLV